MRIVPWTYLQFYRPVHFRRSILISQRRRQRARSRSVGRSVVGRVCAARQLGALSLKYSPTWKGVVCIRHVNTALCTATSRVWEVANYTSSLDAEAVVQVAPGVAGTIRQLQLASNAAYIRNLCAWAHTRGEAPAASENGSFDAVTFHSPLREFGNQRNQQN